MKIQEFHSQVIRKDKEQTNKLTEAYISKLNKGSWVEQGITDIGTKRQA
jgi:hypothetical protein